MAEYGQMDVKYVKGIGEARAKLLGKELGIHTVSDLLYNFPHRYVDRSRYFSIREFAGEMPYVQVLGVFINFSEEGEGARKRLRATFSDGEAMMEVVWFSKTAAIRNTLKTGVEYVLFGKPTPYRGVYSMAHPEIEVFNEEKRGEDYRGIYSLTDTLRKRGFTPRTIRTLVANALQSAAFGSLQENLPHEIISRHNLMPLRDAIRNIHFPTSPTELQKARERFKFEELFYLEMNILRYSRTRGAKVKGAIFPTIGQAFNSFYSKVLPFDLTDAQKRVLREIRSDMRTGRQMNRLLQGDVGSGKTMVAFMSMLMAVDNDYQASLMAPTEILATQHYETLLPWCEKLGLGIRLLTGSTKTSARREIHAGLLDGSVSILVGTHALIEDTVEFRRLGLAVIDEQHRFGVAQRAKMWGKGRVPPHVLVMTATPIPRTLAMTVYGDLEVSVIDQLPPGRKPITTILRSDETRLEVDRLLYREIRAGRQVYIVYPLIHENEKLTLKSLDEGYRAVCNKFPDLNVCFVHGQMKPEEKDYQMQLFAKGEAHIMVATTVIEVGVNVPNASVMVIENAERFGLSQLHQLRGRVGRGADQSYCILMSHNHIQGDTRKRLGIMTETTDGFLISEADMKLRGPGDMEGTMQSGIAFNLKVSDLARDGQMISLARETAFAVLDGNPGLSAVVTSAPSGREIIPLDAASQRLISRELALRFPKEYDWSRIS